MTTAATISNKNYFSKTIIVLAKIVSYIFHPLFIPVYATCVLLYSQPYLFSEIPASNKMLPIIQAFIIYIFFPLITVLLLKWLGFISSIYLHTAKDRIVPYLACMIYYFWAWNVSKNIGTSQPIVAFRLAIFLACIVSFLINIFLKVSMHSVAVGLATCFFFLLAYHFSISLIPIFIISLLICGAVCTSRLLVSSHTPHEIYIGLWVGVMMQLFAFAVVM